MASEAEKLRLHISKNCVPFHGALQYSDGLSCTVLASPPVLITSPNMTRIPFPAVGSQRILRRYTNGRYGPEDYLQWPQYLNPQLLHLCCIPTPPSSPDHPYKEYTYMFHPLQAFDIAPSGASQGRHESSYIVNTSVKGQLLIAVEYVNTQFDSVRAHERTRYRHTEKELDEHLSLGIANKVILNDLCTRIRSESGTKEMLQILFLECQRMWQTLVGFCDFMLDIRSKMLSDCQPPATAQHRVGAFVQEHNHASMLYRAGIPVYFVRKHSEFAGQTICHIAPPMQPSEEQLSEPAAREIIFRGVPSSVDALMAYFQMARTLYQPANFFTDVHYSHLYPSTWTIEDGKASSLLTSLPLMSSSSSLRVASATHHAGSRGGRLVRTQGKQLKKQPYTQRQAKGRGKKAANLHEASANPIERDIYGEFRDSPFTPPSIPAWHGVNAAIVRVGGEQAKQLFLFPEPAMLVANESPELLQLWEEFRHLWFLHISSPSSSGGVAPMSNREWKKLLKWSNSTPWSATDPIPEDPDKQEYRRAYLLGKNLKERYGALQRGSVPVGDDATRFRYFVWELCEISFRDQLLTLDRMADITYPNPRPDTTRAQYTLSVESHRQERMALILQCFPDTSLKVVDGGLARVGLASEKWDIRYEKVFSLALVMETWPRQKPEIWSSNVQHSMAHPGNPLRRDWERSVALFYAQSCYDLLRRPACIPRALYDGTMADISFVFNSPQSN